jgi:translation initiation factor IF-1
MVKNTAGGNNGKKVARKHTTKGKNELRLSRSEDEKYAIVKKLLGNTCDVICDDGIDRRCIIRGKFTGRNKRDNMIDSGIYVLVGMREWVDEGSNSKTGQDKNVKYCDLLEVYNSMERDILRRTHGVFSTIKDESINRYDEREMNVSFVDENTLKYQNMIKNMEGKKSNKKLGNQGGSGSEEEEDDEEEMKGQTTVITTNIKHVGKGVVVQSYDISDEEEEEEEEDGDTGYCEKSSVGEKDNMDLTKNKVVSGLKMSNIIGAPSKKIVYEEDGNIDVNDI